MAESFQTREQQFTDDTRYLLSHQANRLTPEASGTIYGNAMWWAVEGIHSRVCDY